MSNKDKATEVVADFLNGKISIWDATEQLADLTDKCLCWWLRRLQEMQNLA